MSRKAEFKTLKFCYNKLYQNFTRILSNALIKELLFYML